MRTITILKSVAKREEDEKKIRQTLKVHISGTTWRIQFEFGIGGVPPLENVNRKKLCVSVLRVLSYSVFFSPTCLLHAHR